MQFVQCLSCDFGHVHVQCTLGGHSKREGRRIIRHICHICHPWLEPGQLAGLCALLLHVSPALHTLHHACRFLSVVAVGIGNVPHLLLPVVSQTFAQVDSHAHVRLQQGQGMALFCSSTQSWKNSPIQKRQHFPTPSPLLPGAAPLVSRTIGPPVHNTLRSKRIPSALLPALASPQQSQRIARGRRNEAHKA